MKVPTNKVKKASKVAYLGVRNAAKLYSKVNVPLWSKAPEAERDALMRVGGMIFGGTTDTGVILGALKDVPDVAPGSVIGFLTSEDPVASKVLSVYVHTVSQLV